MPQPLRLGVNIDHVATVRNARGGRQPDPVRAALLAEKAGADGITAHLREDRRHIEEAARHGASLGLEVHAGHGLAYDTVKPVAAIPEIAELNIGHFLIGEAIFVGLEESVRTMRGLMDEARAPSSPTP